MAESEASSFVSSPVVNSSSLFFCRIGKALGYKKSELSGLVEGSTLIVGGKEIEVSRCMRSPL